MINRKAKSKNATPRKAGGKSRSADSRHAKALIEAIQCGQSKVAIRLLKEGVDPCARDSKGRSALWWACAWGRSPVIRELVKRGAELPDEALMGVVEAGDVKTVRFLIQHGANVNCIASHYSPVPHHNIKRVLLTAALGRAAFLAKLESIPIMLIRAGAEVNRFILPRPMPGAENRTMLGIAAYSGLLKTVKAMLTAGAKVNLRDNSGKTALAEALEQGHVSVARVLRRAGGKV
jgi:uncharacterized protein